MLIAQYYNKFHIYCAIIDKKSIYCDLSNKGAYLNLLLVDAAKSGDTYNSKSTLNEKLLFITFHGNFILFYRVFEVAVV